MGAELLKFTGFFDNRELLKDFSCWQCKQAISEQDIQQKNYQLWVSDYANEITKNFCGDNLVHGVSFWLKSVEHENCPNN